MNLSSETKLCVTLVLILALLAVLNMNSAQPVANIGAVTQSSSSVISNFTTNSSSKGKLKKKSATSTKNTKTMLEQVKMVENLCIHGQWMK